MEKNFLDSLNDWGTILTDTYEKATLHMVKPTKHESGVLYVPSEYAKNLGTKIGSTVIVPDGVQSIGWNAFTNCTEIVNVQLPDTLTHMGTLAFNECVNLTTINIPSSMERFGNMCFTNCKSLENINLNTRVKTIPPFCFHGCNFKTLEIPSNIKKLEADAFGLCPDLETLKLNEGLTFIGSKAFSSCFKLTGKLVIPRSVGYIDVDAFASTYLDKVYVDKSRVGKFDKNWNRFCPAKIVYY